MKFAKMLGLLGITDEHELKLKCPIWHKMATSPKAFRMDVFREHVTKVFEQSNPSEAARSCASVLTDAHFKLVISLMWSDTHKDSMS